MWSRVLSPCEENMAVRLLDLPSMSGCPEPPLSPRDTFASFVLMPRFVNIHEGVTMEAERLVHDHDG